ncbi:MAG: hypothetical protein V3V12_06260 [Gammaproteobacteria bacterium]
MKNLIAFILVLFATSAIADSEVNAGQLSSNSSVTALSNPDFNILTVQAQVNNQPTTKPGPLLSANTEVTWSYTANNDGNTALHNIDVLRRQKLPTLGAWETACSIGTIEAGQSGSCEASGQIQEGNNLALVTARGNTADGTSVETSRKAFYLGTAFKRIAAGIAFSVSHDGRYVTYTSFANTGSHTDDSSVYLLDRDSGATILISRNDSVSYQPDISGDGRYVAFYTETSTNLIVNVYDRLSEETTQIAVASDDINGFLDPQLSISRDGQYIAFIGKFNKLFVHDQLTSETNPLNPDSFATFPAISGDGRYLAFQSHSSDLVPNDTNGRQDIFVHDRITGANALISVASDGSESNGNSTDSSISSDGRYIAYSSVADNLVTGNTGIQLYAFIHDRHTGKTIKVPASDGSRDASISADGRYVTFTNDAGYSTVSLFIYDRIDNITSEITQGINSSERRYPKVTSTDDNTVSVFISSDGDNLVPDDDNNLYDIFLYDYLTTEPPITPPAADRLTRKRVIALELLEATAFDQITHDAYLAEINAANSVSALHDIILRIRSADIDNTGSNPRLDVKRNIALGVLEAKGFDQATHDALLAEINAASSISELHSIIVRMRSGTVSTTPQLALSLAVTANGSAIDKPGASMPAGSAINWTSAVTNDGNAILHNIVITQRQKLPSLGEWATSCTLQASLPA